METLMSVVGIVAVTLAICLTLAIAVTRASRHHDAGGDLLGVVHAAEVRTRQQAAVADLARRALEGADPRSLLEESARALARNMDVDLVAVLELDDDQASFLLRAGVGWREGVVGRARLDTGRESQPGFTLLANEAVVAEDLEGERRFRMPAVALEHGARSGVTVVIPGRERPFGVLAAHSNRARKYSDDDVQFFTATATMLGSAVEHVLTRERLEATESKYRNLIERLPAVVYSDAMDELSTYLYVSPQVEELLGYSSQEMLEDRELWVRRLHPDDHDRVLAESNRTNATGEPFRMEYRMLHRDGRVIWVRDEAVVLHDESGRPLCWQGIQLDITERKQAEAKYRALVEQIPAVTYVSTLDEPPACIYVSPQIETLLGVPADEWLAAPEAWLASVHREDRTGVRDAYAKHVASGEPFNAEYRMVARDGRVVWVQDQAVVVRDVEGWPIVSQGILSDVTERKRLEDGLRQSYEREREAAKRLRALDEMKNAFLAAVSHELRTPLSSVLGYALTLERPEIAIPDEERRHLTHRLAVNARKLDRLLSDLLDLDRLARGVLQPRYRRTDIAALARRVIEEIDVVGRAVALEASPVHADIDAPKVERIVENLVANAVKHTPAGTRIWVAIAQREDGVQISVEDEGPGIPAEERDSIFEPFRQVDGGTPGTGIGLSLVAQFAELHGGRAWVEERSGGGSSFRVFLGTRPDGHRER